MILSKSFYNRSVLKVAQELLGCFLVRTQPLTPPNLTPSPSPKVGKGSIRGELKGRGIMRFKIVETEAYNGPNDLASHASQGKTERNKVMFGEPGIIYVYFTYGMHYMLNIVIGPKDYPAAVLIRAVEPTSINQKSKILSAQAGKNQKFNGPARLTKALQIDKSFNSLPIYVKKYGLWIEDRQEIIKPSQIVKTRRVGVDYAGEYKDKKWRFYIKDSKFISRK